MFVVIVYISGFKKASINLGVINYIKNEKIPKIPLDLEKKFDSCKYFVPKLFNFFSQFTIDINPNKMLQT
jgi:hypothetical protein